MSNIEPEKNERRADENDNIEESQPDKRKQRLEDRIKCEDSEDICQKFYIL